MHRPTKSIKAKSLNCSNNLHHCKSPELAKTKCPQGNFINWSNQECQGKSSKIGQARIPVGVYKLVRKSRKGKNPYTGPKTSAPKGVISYQVLDSLNWNIPG